MLSDKSPQLANALEKARAAADAARASMEKLCAGRYQQIAEYQRQSNEARAAMQVKLDASFKALYGLQWKAAFGVIVALGGVVLFLAERVIE